MNPNTTQKPTGLNAITSTLTRGSTGDQVKELQRYLIGLGYNNVKADGVFGPITEAAVKQFQLDNKLNSDGKFGPLSLGRAKSIGGSSTQSGVPGTGKAPDDPTNMFNTQTGKLNPKFVPKTQKELDAYYNASVATHPEFAGNSKESLEHAIATGDFSGILNSKGQPFSTADQKDAMLEAEKALRPGFDITKQKDTADTESALAQKQLDYQNWLNTEKSQFEQDKTGLDQTAAEKGVLFSGGRVQKEQNLGDTYSRNQAYRQASIGSDIGSLARNYQSTYGDKAAKGLSNYYKLGGNIYNPNVATGGVSSSGMSSIYNPSGLGYQGTAVVANKAAAQARAAGLLWNKGNKLLSTGYKNQY
jgi:peptidoglycan hydrolase-like protein with peptidoglycan-binding domain